MKMQDMIREAKARHPGMLLMFRMGDFYELFEEDAETAAKVLGLTITRRDELAMAGFPYHQRESYLSKLLWAGHRVAICEPVEKNESPPKHEVTRVVTPGVEPAKPKARRASKAEKSPAACRPWLVIPEAFWQKGKPVTP